MEKSMKAKPKKILIVAVTFLFISYWPAYLKIMEYGIRANSDCYERNTYTQCFSSSARHLPKHSIKFTLIDGDVIIDEYRNVSFWNYVFFPADVLNSVISR